MEPRADDVPFGRTCDEAAFDGDRAICCRGGSYCFCDRVRCGISASSGLCRCGLLDVSALASMVGSCDTMASTCCTQDTGYCYCEEGCEMRFGNRLVGSCDTSTEAATCGSSETQVASCE
jgi:hypothetical protein